MSFGRPYILAIEGYIHDGWLVLRDSNNAFSNTFLYELLSTEAMKKAFSSSARGGVVNNLNKDLVGSITVPIPPKDKQLKYEKFVILATLKLV